MRRQIVSADVGQRSAVASDGSTDSLANKCVCHIPIVLLTEGQHGKLTVGDSQVTPTALPECYPIWNHYRFRNLPKTARRGCPMKKLVSLLGLLFIALSVAAQQNATPVEPMDEMPVFRVKVVSRTTKAVNYRHRGGSTGVDFKGTNLMPEASGKGKVDSKAGRLEISADFAHLAPASKFGAQYLTYVLWAVTPEGRSVNLGEVIPNNEGKFGLEVTTDLQAFGMVVTAEPYFSVTRPSNLVVVENIIRYETKGFEEAIDARFDMLEGGQYTIDVPGAQLPSSTADPKTPLDLL